MILKKPSLSHLSFLFSFWERVGWRREVIDGVEDAHAALHGFIETEEDLWGVLHDDAFMHFTLDGSAILIQLLDDEFFIDASAEDADVGEGLLQIWRGLHVVDGEDDAIKAVVLFQDAAELSLQQLADSFDTLAHGV
jgi:hypothetical protein